mgnify:CR=1 FL=1
MRFDLVLLLLHQLHSYRSVCFSESIYCRYSAGIHRGRAIENGKLNGIHYEAFRLEWSKYDTKGTGLLDVRKLPDLLSHLDAPVGSKGMTDSEQT